MSTSNLTPSVPLPIGTVSLVILEMFVKQYASDLATCAEQGEHGDVRWHLKEIISLYLAQRMHHNPTRVEQALIDVVADLVGNPKALNVRGAIGGNSGSSAAIGGNGANGTGNGSFGASNASNIQKCAHEGLYVRARDSVLTSALPAQEDEAMQLAALQFRAETALETISSENDAVILHEIESRAKRMLPAEFYAAKSAGRKIFFYYNEGVKLIGDRDAKHVYINRCRAMATYGYYFFRGMLATGSDVQNKLVQRKLGVGIDGVLLLDNKTNVRRGEEGKGREEGEEYIYGVYGVWCIVYMVWCMMYGV